MQLVLTSYVYIKIERAGKKVKKKREENTTGFVFIILFCSLFDFHLVFFQLWKCYSVYMHFNLFARLF